MELDIVGLAGACSYALDCIEAELVHVTNKHSKRVAYTSVRIAQALGIGGDTLQDLTVCALLHDNALIQYIYEELQNDLLDSRATKDLSVHCRLGEKALARFPFHTDMAGTILFHHEHADGGGPFGKTREEVPLSARIIHLADMVDILSGANAEAPAMALRTADYVRDHMGTLFDPICADAFLSFCSEAFLRDLRGPDIELHLRRAVPREMRPYGREDCRAIADFFASVVDHKSAFTSRHSLGVADKAARMAVWMGWSPEEADELYLAGALHDIGKMAIGNDILEKPGRLTDEEFSRMKDHAWYTYQILSDVEGLDRIRDWAAFHHEKLDGSGYPFGKSAEELDQKARLMACIDIYQALTEDRPYKSGMSHEAACGILSDMAGKGQLDAGLTEQVRACFAPAETERA